MCAKLPTVAASNNRDHPTRSLSSLPLAGTINCSTGSQALFEVTHQDYSIGITLLLLVRATYVYFFFLAHIPFVVNHTINATPPERLQQNKNFLSPIQSWSANFQTICSPIQSWSGQNWLQSWSRAIQSWSMLISACSITIDMWKPVSNHSNVSIYCALLAPQWKTKSQVYDCESWDHLILKM